MKKHPNEKKEFPCTACKLTRLYLKPTRKSDWGCLTFEAQVRPSDPEFWAYLDDTVLPVIRQNIEGKEWSQISGIRGCRAAYKAFGLDAGLLY